MNEFVRYLKKRSSNDDKVLFNEWMNKKMTTEEAIERFKINNAMPDVIINVNEFTVWLDQLGYRRVNYEE